MSKPHDEPEMHIIIKDRMDMSDFSFCFSFPLFCYQAMHMIGLPSFVTFIFVTGRYMYKMKSKVSQNYTFTSCETF